MSWPGLAARGPAEGTTRGATWLIPALAAALTLTLAGTSAARAQSPTGDERVGRRFVGTSRTIVLQAEDRDRSVPGCHLYRARQAAGGRLLLEPEGGGASGWADAEAVVPVERAMDHFTRRIRNEPRDAYAYLARAMLRAGTNDPGGMLADLKRAEALTPDDPDVYVLRGRAQLLRGEYAAAIAECHHALRLDPDDGRAYEIRGLAKLGRRDHGGALDDLSRAIRQDPQSASGYVNRGNAWLAIGDYNKAILDLTAAIRLAPEDVVAYFNRGVAWQFKGKLDPAIADFDRAIQLDPKHAETYARRAYIWLNTGKLDAAMTDSETAIRLDPGCSSAFLSRGQFRMGRRQFDQALADFDEAIRLEPRNVWAHLGRGKVRELRGEYGRALEHYAEAARLEPTLAVIHNQCAWIRATCPDAAIRDGPKAVEAATRACDLSEWRDPTFLDTLAAACAEAGDFDAAAKWEAKAIAMFPEGREKAEAESHLKLYRSRTAYHLPDR